MAEPRTRKAPEQPASPLTRSLVVMGSRHPTIDEITAIRALMRGFADAGQQRKAMAYMLVELCHVGSVPFAGENTHGASFRAGSMGVGVTLAQIADAVLMTFPGHSEPVHGEGVTSEAGD